MFRFTLSSLTLSAAFTASSLAQESCPNQKGKTQTVSHTVKKSEQADIVKTAATAGQFKTLVSLLVAADLVDTLKGEGPFAVFAPTDEAFAKLPKGTLETLLKPENKKMLQAILTYHVVPHKASFRFEHAEPGQVNSFRTVNGKEVTLKNTGNGYRVNDSKIVTQNIVCSNGSVQVIDAVLLPPSEEKANRIPDIAANAGSFKTLLAALKAAELADVLAGDGPFTVFAPTDDAFAKLPEGTVAKLLKPENRDQLVAILKYHVVAGKKSARDLIAGGSAKTLQTGTLSASIVDGSVNVNKSKVIKSDIAADNGVIHVIDTVLIPAKR
jgi:transforming growth factor-beta-induced protein